MARVTPITSAASVRERAHSNSITAAVQAVSPREVASLMTGGANTSYWRYYRHVPDVRYTANLTGRLLSMSLPRLEWMNNSGVWGIAPEPAPEPVLGALATIYDSPGGLEDVSRRFGQQYSVDGQAWFVTYNKGGHAVVESMSNNELGSNGQKFYRKVNGNGVTKDLPRGAKATRVWRRDPERSHLAETPLEALSADMETLIALNAALRARVRSRLASAGILFLPNSLVIASPAEAPDGTGQPNLSVTRALLEAMAAAIENPESPEAVMPIVVEGPDDAGALIRHVTLDRLIEDNEMRLRNELRDNIRDGMDAPKNIISDEIPNVNHWNQASIKMEMWEHTVAPIGDILWEGLSQVVLRPWLEKKGVDDAFRYRWRCDRDSVQIRNNQDEKTRVAIDRNLVSDTAARRRLGISEDDAPAKDEYVRMVGQQMGIPELAFYKLDVGGIDLSQVTIRKTGPARSGNGRDMPADVPGDEPEPDKERRVR